MIVDCHTQIWQKPQQLGVGAAEYIRRQGGETNLIADVKSHWAAADCVERSFVLGLRSSLIGAAIPNASIAAYVGEHPDRLVGFAGVDPMAADLDDVLAEIDGVDAFGGVVVSPAAQGFHPADTHAAKVYDFCVERGLAMMIEPGMGLAAKTRVEFARPYLWDEVLREYPNLAVVIGHMGYPWTDETIALLGKHRRLYADVAALVRRPWCAYNVLVAAHQFGVIDKLLFGSDFPFLTASEAVESFYRLNEAAHGTSMPVIPREALRGIVERDTPAALGIGPA